MEWTEFLKLLKEHLHYDPQTGYNNMGNLGAMGVVSGVNPGA